MKKHKYIGLFFLLTLLWSSIPGHADSLYVKLGTILETNHPSSQAMRVLQQKAQATPDNQINIQVFPDSRLGTAHDILQGIRFGSIEMGLLSSEILVPLAPYLTAVSMPYIFRDDEHRFHVLDGPVGQQLLDSLQQQNLVGLGFFDTGMKHFVTLKQPLTAPEDFHNVNIGRFGLCCEEEHQNLAWKVSAEALTILGATIEPVQEKDDEEESRQFDMWEGNELDFQHVQFPETESLYLTYSKYTMIPDILVVNKPWFDSLQPQIRKELQKAVRQTIQHQRTLWNAMIQEKTLQLEAKGMKFERLEREPFYQASQPVYEHMNNELGADFERLIKAIRTVN